MENALILFGSTFVLVFALGFQTLNVNNSHYKGAFLTSLLLGAANLVILRVVPQGNVLEGAAYLLGGPFGVITSMWIHARYFKNDKTNGDDEMAKLCNANDCLARVDHRNLMCLKHWRMVPEELQYRVWTTYKRRGVLAHNPAGWADYYEACAEAIEHVAQAEGKNTCNSFRRLAPKLRAFAAEQQAAAGAAVLR